MLFKTTEEKIIFDTFSDRHYISDDAIYTSIWETERIRHSLPLTDLLLAFPNLIFLAKYPASFCTLISSVVTTNWWAPKSSASCSLPGEVLRRVTSAAKDFANFMATCFLALLSLFLTLISCTFFYTMQKVQPDYSPTKTLIYLSIILIKTFYAPFF